MITHPTPSRFKPGDLVILKARAGFAPPGTYRILPEEGDALPCLEGCGDPNCREWATLEQVSPVFFTPTGGMGYHVAECRMTRVKAATVGQRKRGEEPEWAE